MLNTYLDLKTGVYRGGVGELANIHLMEFFNHCIKEKFHRLIKQLLLIVNFYQMLVAQQSQ